MSTVPTATEIELLISSVGDFGDDFLRTNLPATWALYDGYGGRLQYLYTRRDMIDQAMGEVRKRVSFQAERDVGVDNSDLIKALLAMKKDLLAEIAKEEELLVVVADGEGFFSYAGEMLTTGSTSFLGPSGGIDANSLIYRGEPYGTRARRLP